MIFNELKYHFVQIQRRSELCTFTFLFCKHSFKNFAKILLFFQMTPILSYNIKNRASHLKTGLN